MHSFAGKQILVVQPLPAVCAGLKWYIDLESDMRTCGEARTLAQARELVQQKKPDLVILDPFMEREAGFALLEELTRPAPAVHAVVYASHLRLDHLKRSFEAGASAVISHQEDGDGIRHALLSVLGGANGVVAVSSLALTEEVCRSRTQVSQALLNTLSAQERRVFDLFGKGAVAKEIAAKLNISASSVESYETRLRKKLSLESNSELKRSAIIHAAMQESL